VDKKARSNLRKVVGQARQLLEEDVRTQLKRLGIEEGGKTIPAGRLSHLSREDKELRDKILVAVRKEQVKNIKLKEAYDRYVRHVGFTYLNRLAALRAMEVRDLIEETMIRRDQYAGMSRREYELSEREGLSDRDEIAKKSLFEAFNEVSQEIKVLFDVNDEYSLLFPSPRILDKLLDLLEKNVPHEDWCEDDVIGWIYQYYNSEARAEFKKNRRKPRPDDIPVINQFYTPRWLVKALVDNTLGRLWLEMKGRMPKPGEAKALSGEELRNPQGEKVDEYCSYLIPSRQNPPFREQKSVREIKVLDPACGSGHFLIYAFNVLYRMYLEAEPETPREEIPRLILENNLFGIDIDLRSVQLAAIGLFLKAKEYNPDTKIVKMNLVCADVRIIDGTLQRTFISRLEHDIDLQRIFRKLFEELEFTYDVGGLLKVRAPFERLLDERKKGVQARFQPKITGQSFLSKKGNIGGQSELSIEDEKQGVLVKPAVTLDEMLNALLDFEREGMEKKDMGTMLFAGEAEKSVGLLSILSQRYDVVVMNPPYGDMPKTTKEYAKKHYPRTHRDYYAAFIEQAVNLCCLNGFIGMLTGRTFLFLTGFEKVRREILFKEAKPEIILDLGYEILDEATGIWAASTIRKISAESHNNPCSFLRLFDYRGEECKKEVFQEILKSVSLNQEHKDIYFVALKSLMHVPRMSYCYWVPSKIREIYGLYPPLDRDLAKKPREVKIADAKQGLATGADMRFLRFFWEIKTSDIGLNKEETSQNKKWVPFIKGSWLNPFFFDVSLVVNWENNGEAMRRYADRTGKPRVQNEPFYFREGISWIVAPQLGSILKGTLDSINSFYLPRGCIFSVTGSAMFAPLDYIWKIIGLINSSLYYYLIRMITPRLLHVGYMAQLPFPIKADLSQIEKLSKEAYDLLKEWDTGNEISTNFIKPWMLHVKEHIENMKPETGHPLSKNFKWSDWKSTKEIRTLYDTNLDSIVNLIDLCTKREFLVRKRLNEIDGILDDQIYPLFGIEEKERKIIEKSFKTNNISKSESEKVNLRPNPKISKKEHVYRLLSYYIKQILESDADGIIPLSELLQKIRVKIAKEFDVKKAEDIEQEISKILGKSIEDWLTDDFFEFHIGLYRRRPIFWHLTSANYSSKRGRCLGTFNCLLYYHKLSKDTIPKIRTKQEYLKGLLEGARWKTERLRRELQEAKNSEIKRKDKHLQKECEEALDEYKELQAFDQKLAEVSNPREKPTPLDEDSSWVEKKISEVRDNGWNPVLDYGVRVNIEPLKEAGLLPRAADRVK